ncbi:unnamed protein product [Adineta ricciae]|uniref:Protein arginine N-methyltransferase domain-containing protein n=1 Tax=Adineta ricciae TaxID=249248 RepID=A0A814SG73_ADIRI|nr:unnamed protein product [Adineta ricciae]CAF1451909.1 unnamed protein product [Adineta ricciae]
MNSIENTSTCEISAKSNLLIRLSAPSNTIQAKNLRVDTYASFWIQREMLFDQIRTNSYRRAILDQVKQGDVVVDFGAGTGILSMFAAKAGAKKVYALEITDMADVAVEMIKRNKLDHIITVIKQDGSTVQLPEKADVLVSEWMGGLGVDENFVPPLLATRNNVLKPNGIMIPATAKGYAALADDPSLTTILSFWYSKPYDLDLDMMGEFHGNTVLNARHSVLPDQLLSKEEELYELIMKSANKIDADFSFSGESRIIKDGSLSCIAAWFQCDMGNQTVLSNAPDKPATHWGRTSFPIYPPIPVSAGQIVRWTLSSSGVDLMKAIQSWSIRVHMPDGSVVARKFSGTQTPVHSSLFH